MKTQVAPLLISTSLLVVSIVGYRNSTSECYRSTQALADIKTLQMSLLQYKVRNGHEPTEFVGLAGLVSDRLVNEYALIDPWGPLYGYREPTERSDAGIYSSGLDQISSTGGDDPDDLNSWDVTEAYYKARRRFPISGEAWQMLGVISFAGVVLTAVLPHQTAKQKQNQAEHAER